MTISSDDDSIVLVLVSETMDNNDYPFLLHSFQLGNKFAFRHTEF